MGKGARAHATSDETVRYDKYVALLAPMMLDRDPKGCREYLDPVFGYSLLISNRATG